jgi:type I restriction enzyme M protein
LDKRLEASHLEGDAEIVENVEELHKLVKEEGGFDVVLTNPPFSMKKELRNESEAVILKQYDLARKSESSGALRPSLRSSVMSIERYYDLLKDDGRLITVIDDTLLSSGNFDYLRDFIRKRYLIRAIISLPGDTFRRSGSRVKTSVLVLEKKRKQEDEQPGCFAFFSEFLGVDDLTPRASEVDIQEARAKAENETNYIVDGYKAYLSGIAGPLVLKPEMIADRLDLKYCVPLFGRMAQKWRKQGIEVKEFGKCVQIVEDEVVPQEHPDVMFNLIKVTYDGICATDKTRLGNRIKAPKMYRVKKGHLVFSTIRATDGAIGIVPPELDGALVAATSYNVFECGSAEDTAYLWAVLRSHEIRADMQSLSPGSGRYTSYWPDVGRVLIPWLSAEKRKAVGKQFLDAWTLERQMVLERQKAELSIACLGVESEEAKKRWNASKAPK